MATGEDFIKDLVQAIAVEAVKTSTITHAVSQVLRDEPKLVEVILDRLDPEMLAYQIAHQIVYQAKKNNDHAIATYTSIMKNAQKIAEQELAKEILHS